MKIKGSIRTAADRLLYSLFPKRCCSCGELITPSEYACVDCSGGITRIYPPVCLHCGMSRDGCICSDKRLIFEHIAAPFIYDGTVRKLLGAFKFDGERDLKEFFAVYMAQTAAREYFDVHFDFVTGVPMTAAEKRKRGYNQSELLAKRVGELLEIEFSGRLLQKTAETQKQHTLTAAERRINLVGAFSAEPKLVAGKTVLLCDDIKTTGSTLYNCCDILKNAGADAVYCLCAALTRQT